MNVQTCPVFHLLSQYPHFQVICYSGRWNAFSPIEIAPLQRIFKYSLDQKATETGSIPQQPGQIPEMQETKVQAFDLTQSKKYKPSLPHYSASGCSFTHAANGFVLSQCECLKIFAGQKNSFPSSFPNNQCDQL